MVNIMSSHWFEIIANRRIFSCWSSPPCRNKQSHYYLEVQKVNGQRRKPPKILIIIVSADDCSLS